MDRIEPLGKKTGGSLSLAMTGIGVHASHGYDVVSARAQKNSSHPRDAQLRSPTTKFYEAFN